MNKYDLINAMKAERIPAGFSNLWYITKTTIEEATRSLRNDKPVIVPPGEYTFLYKITDSTLYYDPPGIVVMEDTPFELETHLGFVMSARGKVLITGLGLGCVIRGLLENPGVESVTCIENSKDVLRLVAPYMPKDRLTIIEADALKWTESNKNKFDCAWHDLFTDRDRGEPHLDHWHSTLIMNCRATVKYQGAWMFDKQVKRYLLNHGFKWMG